MADGFDLHGPAAEIIMAVLSWSAKMERIAINERIADSRERVEAEGRSWARPKRMDDGLIAKARSMKANGRTIREIAVALKIPRATIGRALSQKVAVSEAA